MQDNLRLLKRGIRNSVDSVSRAVPNDLTDEFVEKALELQEIADLIIEGSNRGGISFDR